MATTPNRAGGELGAFLRARRQELRPMAASTGSGTRRVAGLRREEVARLAGVSVDYYARLEQGRQRNVSESVLTALSAALQLSPTQSEHLFTLAASPAGPQRYPAQSARRGLIRLIENVGVSPALVLGRGADVLAANDAARAAFADFHAMPSKERNFVRWFLLESAATHCRDWETMARDLVGLLRVEHGRYPGDPRLAGVVEELTEGSELFREMWAQRYVAWPPAGGTVEHPDAGTLRFDIESISANSDRNQSVLVFMPVPGSGTAEAVTRLVGQFRARSRHLSSVG